MANDYLICDTGINKYFRSWGYNYNFSRATGEFWRWSKTPEEDPHWSPFGPEIADIEISIDGCPNACPWCYKGNKNKEPTNMPVGTFM